MKNKIKISLVRDYSTLNLSKINLSKTNYKQELINLFAFQKNIIEHKIIEDYEYINLQIPHQIVVKEKNI